MAEVRPHRMPLAVALLCAPAVLVLAVLAALGEIGAQAAAASALAVLVGTSALVGWHFRDVASLRHYVENLRQTWEDDAPVPAPPIIRSPGLDQNLGNVIAETARERQQRRQELRTFAARQQSMLAALPDPLLMLDRHGRIADGNPAARQLFGDGIQGRALSTVLRHPDLLAAGEEVLGGGQGRSLEFTLPGAVERIFTARLEPLDQQSSDSSAAVISFHDVTGLRRAERMRADFVANASHELRTPLSSLLGFIETLQGPAKDDPEGRERFLAIMLEQAWRMSILVEDLLSLSRIELDEHSPPTGKVDIVRVLKRVAAELELKAKEKEMRVVLSGMRALPPVLGDADQISQVFQNLVDNAIKYGHHGTDVRIIAEAPAQDASPARRSGADTLSVSVLDQGEGIAREHIPRLTERFYRVDTARSRSLGGTGLGLAIVKHIVNRHRGRLEITSEVGQGSRFTVHLPLAEPAARTKAAE